MHLIAWTDKEAIEEVEDLPNTVNVILVHKDTDAYRELQKHVRTLRAYPDDLVTLSRAMRESRSQVGAVIVGQGFGFATAPDGSRTFDEFANAILDLCSTAGVEDIILRPYTDQKTVDRFYAAIKPRLTPRLKSVAGGRA